MKKLLIGSAILVSSLFAFATYNKVDTTKIRIETHNESLTYDKRAMADISISNRNDYAIKNITIECVGATDDINARVELFSKTYNTYIPANSSKSFKNEFLGHYNSKVIMVICVEVAGAQKG